MGASEAMVAELRTMLLGAPAGAREALAPETIEGKLFFTLPKRS